MTREEVIILSKSLGAELIGFAPVERWDEYDEVARPYRPKSVWQPTETVIVLGIPLILPMVETTPSIVYSELYNTTNTLLDQMAYRLSIGLMKEGHRALFLPRDGYGDIEILVEKPVASFGHVKAAEYGGLGTIGYNNCLLNPTYGPRVRYVSILTDTKFEGTPMIEENLCINCGICKKLCPSQAFQNSDNNRVAKMDKVACAKHHVALRNESRYPCGICVKVCPIGQDRQLFQSNHSQFYLNEKEAISNKNNDFPYQSWSHIRDHGSSGNRKY